MKNYAIAAALIAAFAFASPAAAEGWYAGAGYTQFQGDGADVGGVTGRLGYGFHPNFAVEGEASFGVGDDDGVELDQSYAAYGVGVLPINDAFSVHGRVGYAKTETNLGEDDGVAYGAGAQWNMSPSFGIRADYTRLSGDVDDVDTVGVGAVMRF
jgi:outer membrane immunogenic protein